MSTEIRKFNTDDREWMITLFGTAVGAGVLVLPINAGLGGIWPLIAMTVLIGPMTFLAHRGLARVCLTSSHPDGDITDAVEDHFGAKAGTLITLGYFLAIYPIVMIYGILLTNTISQIMVEEMGMAEPNRAILSLVIVAGLVLIMIAGEKFVLKLTSLIVWPLIAILFCVSLWLIQYWEPASQFSTEFSWGSFFNTMLITIPVLVFSFNHSPAVSTTSSHYRRTYGDEAAEPLVSRVLKRTSMLLVGFVMLFVFSCVFTLSPDELAQAKADNLSVMSAFAREFDSKMFTWLAYIVALVAITSSFFGHYMGTAEGLKGLVVKAKRAKDPSVAINHKALDIFAAVFIVVTVWLVAWANVGVMGLIEALVAPILAAILFLMPVIAARKVPAMQKYQSPVDIFTFSMGIITIIGFVIANFF